MKIVRKKKNASKIEPGQVRINRNGDAALVIKTKEKNDEGETLFQLCSLGTHAYTGKFELLFDKPKSRDYILERYEKERDAELFLYE